MPRSAAGFRVTPRRPRKRGAARYPIRCDSPQGMSAVCGLRRVSLCRLLRRHTSGGTQWGRRGSPGRSAGYRAGNDLPRYGDGPTPGAGHLRPHRVPLPTARPLAELRALLQELTDGNPTPADQLLLLVEGATVVARPRLRTGLPSPRNGRTHSSLTHARRASERTWRRPSPVGPGKGAVWGPPWARGCCRGRRAPSRCSRRASRFRSSAGSG